MDSVTFCPISEALAAIRAGKLVVVVDDERRENEGDLVGAAQSITPEIVDFLLRQGRGFLSVPVAREIVDRLHLAPMIDSKWYRGTLQPPFWTLVDHCESGTGVSAANRARTIRALADPTTDAHEFRHPGHVPVLVAMEGGVLRRAGHTEATVDLMRLAGLERAGVSCEILSPHGHGMATRRDIQAIAQQFDIPVISIEDLIRYRRTREQLVQREIETVLPSRYGELRLIAYSVRYEHQSPLAIVHGDLPSVPAPLVRIYASHFGADLIASLRRDGHSPFHQAMDVIRRDGTGVIVCLGHEQTGIATWARHSKNPDELLQRGSHLGPNAVRDRMIGLQILKDLELTQIRLLTERPGEVNDFPWSAMEIDVVEQVPLEWTAS